MTGKNLLTVLLATVMVASVVGTYSWVGAQEGRDVRPPRPRGEADASDRAERDRRERLDADRQRLDDLDRRAQEEMERRLHRREQERLEAEREMARRWAEGDPDLRGPIPPEHREEMMHFQRMMGMLEQMARVSFDPEAAALMAIGGLRDDIHRKPEEVIEDLHNVLKRTRTLGLRNAIRLSLRDLYRHTDQHDKLLSTLREMIAENDEFLARQQEEHEEEEAEERDEGDR